MTENPSLPATPVRRSAGPLRPSWRAQLGALSLALMLSAGTLLAWGMACGWIIGIIESAQRRGANVYHEYVQIAKDGTPILYRYPVYEPGKMEMRDLEGNAVPKDSVIGQLRLASFWSLDQDRPTGIEPADANDARMVSFTDFRPDRVYWYLVPGDDRETSAYFVGYYRDTKYRAGYIGINGFQEDPPGLNESFRMPTRRFDRVVAATYAGFMPYSGEPTWAEESQLGGSGDLRGWMVYLHSGTEVLAVDLRERSVRKIFESPDLLSLSIFEEPARLADAQEGDVPKARTASPPTTRRIAIRTSERIIALDADGKEVGSYVLPEELHNDQFTFAASPGGPVIAIFTHRDREAGRAVQRVLFLDAAGKQVRPPFEVSNYPFNVSRGGTAMIVGVVSPSLASGGVALAYLYPDELIREGAADDYSVAFVASLDKSWPGWLLLFAMTGLAVAIYVRRQRQFGEPVHPAWIAFLFLLGLPGLTGYFWHRRWPVRAACPTCSTIAPRDRPDCIECGSPFPPPARNGLEVFA